MNNLLGGSSQLVSSWTTAFRRPWGFLHTLDATQLVRGGWGGGMITFLALAHMLDAAQLVRGGWGGGWSHSLHLHTCWMLRNWSGVGGGGITLLALAHMLDAAQLVRGGWGGGWSHSLHLHTCWMLRNWSGVGGGGDHTPCTCTHVGYGYPLRWHGRGPEPISIMDGGGPWFHLQFHFQPSPWHRQFQPVQAATFF